LKRGWTRFWLGGSALPLCFLPVSATAFAQGPEVQRHTESNVKSVSTQPRNDELTLASLRPGRDDIAKAERLFREPTTTKFDGTNKIWQDPCHHQLLSIIPDPAGSIMEIRVAELNTTASSRLAAAKGCDSAQNPHYQWITGHGLRVGSSCSRAIAIYGQPGSRGPSTKDGQQLELLYYAFDWAGPDVPQVMAVLCTPQRNAKPGRVVEITLAAPSL
jgi:hypothetical protein